MVPKLLRLLKLAKKEKNQMQESFQLAILKTRRDLESSNIYWGNKVEELEMKHANELREHKKMVISKAAECQRLRVRNEELVGQFISTEKQLRYLQVEKANETEYFSRGVEDESRMIQILQEQLDESNANLKYQTQQNSELSVVYEARQQSMDEEHERVIETVTTKLSLVMKLLQETFDQQDLLLRKSNLHRLQQEMESTIVDLKEQGEHTVESRFRPSSPISPIESVGSDVFEDCIMERGEDARPLMIMASSESHSFDESASPPRRRVSLPSSSLASTEQNDPYDKSYYKQAVKTLDERLQYSANIQDGLEREISELNSRLVSVSEELSGVKSHRDNMLHQYRQEAESRQQSMLGEQERHMQLQSAYYAQVKGNEALQLQLSRGQAEKQQVQGELIARIDELSNEKLQGEAERKNLLETINQMESDHNMAMNSLRQVCDSNEDKLNDAMNEMRRLASDLESKRLENEALVAQLGAIRGQVLNLQSKIEALQKEKNQIECDLMSKNEDLTEQLSHKREKSRKLQNTINEMEGGHQTTIESLRIECEDTRKELTSSLELYEASKAQMETELSSAIAQLSAANDTVRVLESKHAEAILDMRGELANSSRELSVAKETIIDLRNDIIHLQHKLEVEALRSDLDRSKTQVRHDEQIAATQKDLSRAVDEAADLRAKMDRITEEHKAEKENIRKMLEGKSRGGAEVDKLKKQLADDKIELTNLRLKIRTLESTHASAIQNLLQEHQEKVTVLELDHAGSLIELESKHNEEVSLLQDQILETVSAKNTEIDAIKRLCNQLEDEKMRLQDELSIQALATDAANEAEVNVLKQYTQQLENSIEESQRALMTAKARQHDLIDQIDRLQTQLQTLSSPAKKKECCDEKENNERSLLFSPGADPSRRNEIEELRRGLFASDVGLQSDEDSQIRRRADDSSILDQTYRDINTEEEFPDWQLAPQSPGRISSDANNNSFQPEEWQERCFFLEHDRDDLVRVTEDIVEEERATQQWQLQAAIATTRREEAEMRIAQRNYTQIQMKKLYKVLCSACRDKIDSA